MSGWSSPSRNISPPIMIHCEWRKPLHHDQRPSRLVAAGRDRDLAGRRRRGGDAGGLVAAPDVVLRLLREVRQDAGVIAEIVQAPGRRAAGRFAELDGDVEHHLVVVLVAAPALGLQRVDQAGVDVFLDRLARNVAVALGLDRALAQLGRQRAGARDKLLGGRNLLRRSGGRLASARLMALTPVAKDCATKTEESSIRAQRQTRFRRPRWS